MIVWSSEAQKFWRVMNASHAHASLISALSGGSVTPDKAKRHQLVTDGASAPSTHAAGFGVDTKYSR